MGTQNRRHQIVAHLADRQYGVVSRAQLLRAGLSSREIGIRIRRGLLIRLHRGVYAVGHDRLRRDGRWMAGVLAAGQGAVLSHRDAAILHGLGPFGGERVEVTAPGDARGDARLRVFARRALAHEEVTTVARIPATTVARTLVDLGDLLDHERLLRTFSAAERAGTLDLAGVERALARSATRPGPGHRRVTAVLAEHASRGAQLTNEELELRLRKLVRTHGLPPAELNARVAGEEVDACWRAAGVIVETDGWRFHRGRAAFQRDRAKSNRLTLLGWTVLRFTHDDVARRPAQVADAIGRAVNQR
jgi:very-short-patch-repair endonuclease